MNHPTDMKYLLLLAALAASLQAATVTFEWDPSPTSAEEQLTEYRLYKADGTNWLRIATVPASTNRASVDLPVGRHVITARSVNAWGESTNSNMVALPGPATAPFIRSVTVTIE
jgi:predicted phage tail protein